MSVSTAPSIHPVFIGSAFISDPDLNDLVGRVMQDETADALPINGLEGRISSGESSCCVICLINTVCVFFQKIWHLVCMNLSSSYCDRFTRAVQRITLADRTNQELIAELTNQRELQMRLAQEEQQREQELQAAIDEMGGRIETLRTEIHGKKINLEDASIEFQRKNEVLQEYLRANESLAEITPKHVGHTVFNYFWNKGPVIEQAQKAAKQAAEHLRGTFGAEAELEDAQQMVRELQSAKNLIQAELRELKAQKRERKIELNTLQGGEEPGAVKERPVIQTPESQMLDTIAAHADPGLSAIWKMAFDKAESNNILSWSFDEASKTCTLILFKPIQLWVPALTDEGQAETTGGSVILIGNNAAKTIKFQLDTEKKEMKFDTGFEIYFYYNILGSKYHRQNIVSLQHFSDQQIRFTIQMMGRQHKDKTLQNFENNWREQGVIIDEFESYLKNKVNNT